MRARVCAQSEGPCDAPGFAPWGCASSEGLTQRRIPASPKGGAPVTGIMQRPAAAHVVARVYVKIKEFAHATTKDFGAQLGAFEGAAYINQL